MIDLAGEYGGVVRRMVRGERGRGEEAEDKSGNSIDCPETISSQPL